MNPSGMALVEELETNENSVRKVMWICIKGHHGITTLGYKIVCPQCCHDGEVPAGFTCSSCGEVGYARCPTCNAPRSALAPSHDVGATRSHNDPTA